MAILSIKYMTPEKLHISQGPGWYSFAVLFGLLSVSFWAAIYHSNNVTTKTVYIIGSLLLGLTCMDDWEDWVLDREVGLCTVTRCNWYERLRCQAKESSTVQAKLSDVLAAYVQPEKGLTLVLKSGTTISSQRERQKKMKKKSTTFMSLQNVAKEISRFLQLERIDDISQSKDLNLATYEVLMSRTLNSDSNINPSPPTPSTTSPRREYIDVIYELPQVVEITGN